MELRRFFGNRGADDADDLTQETLMAIVCHLHAVSIRASFRSYVFAVARRKLVDAFRRDEMIARRHDENAYMGQPALYSVAALDLAAMPLVPCLQVLPRDDQQLLAMRYVARMSGPQLARRFRVPEGTIRSRLRRALSSLREALDATDHDERSTDDGRGFERWAHGHGACISDATITTARSSAPP